MAEKTKPEAGADAPATKARKPRKSRNFHLVCGTTDGWKVVAQGNTLAEVRDYTPTDEQDGCTFMECVQIGKPFILRREQTTVRSNVK